MITSLDEVLDDVSRAVSPARPGKVSSPEGTKREAAIEAGYINGDAGSKLPPDVDALFGATKSYFQFKREKFEHRLMLWYKLQGYSNVEVSRILGYSAQAVSAATKQPWFQEAFCKLAAEMGKDAITTFLEGEILPAIQRTAELAKSADSDAVRLAANRELMDRFLGKSTVKIETKGTVDITTTTLDAAKLLEEERHLNEKLRANGLIQHGNS
jgi:hypothetical protein